MEKEIDLSREDEYGESVKQSMQRYLERLERDPEGLESDPEYWGCKRYFFYTENGENKRVKIKKIAYLEANDNYVHIYFRDGKCALVRSSMYKILIELPFERFMKINRSHWVVIKHVTAWTKEYVKINNIELPIIKSCLPEVAYRFWILGTY